MAIEFDPGALLARSFALPRGPRVCLRLARLRDRAGIEALLERATERGHGADGPLAAAVPALDELDVARLLRPDPRQTLVLVATALIGTVDLIVGLGAIELGGASSSTEPSLIVVDHELTDGLDELLERALVGRSQVLRRRRAA